MLPAHQLETGTTVAAGSFDEPGVLFLPRLNAQLTRGLGGGDLTVNVGAVPLDGSFFPGGGLTGRYYLSDRLNAELQLQVTAMEDGWTRLGLVGIQEAPTEQDPLYVGGQVGVIDGRAYEVGPGRGPPITAPVIGASVGTVQFHPGTPWQVQVELESNAPLPFGTDGKDLPIPATRLSVGLFGVLR
jgi:hypothetical protein